MSGATRDRAEKCSPEDLRERLAGLFADDRRVQLVCLFGSSVRDRLRFDSDLDIGVASAGGPLPPAELRAIAQRIVEQTGRAADVVDLAVAPIPVLRAALAKGRVVLCADRSLMHALLRRLVHETADFLPYQRRLLRERRRRWIAT